MPKESVEHLDRKLINFKKNCHETSIFRQWTTTENENANT